MTPGADRRVVPRAHGKALPGSGAGRSEGLLDDKAKVETGAVARFELLIVGKAYEETHHSDRNPLFLTSPRSWLFSPASAKVTHLAHYSADR